MSLQTLKSDLKGLLRQEKPYREVQRILGGNVPGFNGKLHFLTIHKTQMATKLKAAVEQALREHFGKNVNALKSYQTKYASILTVSSFEDAINDVLSTFTVPALTMFNTSRFFESNEINGLYLDSKQVDTLLVLQDKNIYNRGDKFRDRCFEKWQDNNKGKGTTGKPYKLRTADVDLDVAHDPDTTVWVGFVEFRAAQVQSELNISVNTYDIAQGILEALTIEWKEEDLGLSQGIGQKRIMKVSLGPDNLNEILDAGGADRIIKAISSAQIGIITSLWYMNPIKAFKAVASKPYEQKALDIAKHKLIDEVIKKNRKRISSKKISTKKPQRKPRGANLKTAKRIKGKKRKVNLAQKLNVTAKQEKGTGKGSETQTAADLARLRKYIQGRLPAEVRRNMGPPALTNRTGRFSNSVQLLSLQEAGNQIMAKYTYLLSPYETFENTGKRAWPLSYNPRPLIAKSIRNLAQGRIEQRLFSRRA